MKKYFRFLAVALAATMTFALASCGDDKDEPAGGSSNGNGSGSGNSSYTITVNGATYYYGYVYNFAGLEVPYIHAHTYVDSDAYMFSLSADSQLPELDEDGMPMVGIEHRADYYIELMFLLKPFDPATTAPGTVLEFDRATMPQFSNVIWYDYAAEDTDREQYRKMYTWENGVEGRVIFQSYNPNENQITYKLEGLKMLITASPESTAHPRSVTINGTVVTEKERW